MSVNSSTMEIARHKPLRKECKYTTRYLKLMSLSMWGGMAVGESSQELFAQLQGAPQNQPVYADVGARGDALEALFHAP